MNAKAFLSHLPNFPGHLRFPPPPGVWDMPQLYNITLVEPHVSDSMGAQQEEVLMSSEGSGKSLLGRGLYPFEELAGFGQLGMGRQVEKWQHSKEDEAKGGGMKVTD